MFKKIVIDGETTTLSISDRGQIRNDLNGHFLKGTIMNGYRYFSIRWNNKQKTKSLHRMLAEAFIPNPNNYPMVDHIDGNRLNNDLSNLQWVSASENRKKAQPPKHKAKDENSNTSQNEEWRYFRNSCYQVSNYGRVKNTKTNKISHAAPGDDGYIRTEIHLPGEKRKKFLVHQLVYECFCCETFDVINHKNGNKSDNRIENLESVTQQENMQHAARHSCWQSQKPVAMYDNEGNYIRTFLNTTLAAEFMGMMTSSMRNVINARNGRTRGYIFKYINQEEASTTFSE